MRERKLQRQAQQEIQKDKDGLTKEELDRIMAEGDKITSKVDESSLTKKDIQKMAQKLEELYQDNQNQRKLHEKEPEKFMDSESQLHSHLHEL